MFRPLKSLPKLVALSGLAVFAAACATDATAPLAAAPLAPTSGLAAQGTTVGDTLVVQFVITPTSRTTIWIGEHRLKIPANTTCDPQLSTYGPTEWDKKCTLLTTSLTMSVKSWTNAQGYAQLDFSRDLRFVPGKGGDLPVLHFMDKAAVLNPYAKILYCATPTGTCIDESLTDPSVATQTDASNGYIYRIIKHFSGYNVWA